MLRYLLHCLVLLQFGLPWTQYLSAETRLPQATTKVDAHDPRDAETYLTCRRRVLKGMQSSDLKVTAKMNTLRACSEQFPAAAVYVECKRHALSLSQLSEPRAKAALAQCREEHRNISFDPSVPNLPFYLLRGRLYFGGAEFSTTRRLAPNEPNHGDFGNYACPHLQQALHNKGKVEYLLFGNEANAVPAFAKLSPAKLKSLLALKASPSGIVPSYADSPILGRIFTDNRKREIAYEPLAYCHFSRRLGTLYEGLKLYYLVDRPNSRAEPLFGVAFFNPKTSNKPAETLANEVAKALGPDYRRAKNARGLYFVARAPLKETDSDGDPLNVCKSPGGHGFIGIIKPAKKGVNAEALIISDVARLCNYIDAKATAALKRP